MKKLRRAWLWAGLRACDFVGLLRCSGLRTALRNSLRAARFAQTAAVRMFKMFASRTVRKPSVPRPPQTHARSPAHSHATNTVGMPTFRTRRFSNLSNWSNWGQIPIQDSQLSGARGAERNWALTPIAGPSTAGPQTPIATATSNDSRMRTPSFSSSHKLIGVRVQFRSSLLRAVQTLVLNWNLTPINFFTRYARRWAALLPFRTRHSSNWGQIPIQDSKLSGARGAKRNWALTPIAGPSTAGPQTPSNFFAHCGASSPAR
jgi:hypothetical protein